LISYSTFGICKSLFNYATLSIKIGLFTQQNSSIIGLLGGNNYGVTGKFYVDEIYGDFFNDIMLILSLVTVLAALIVLPFYMSIVCDWNPPPDSACCD
jgi:hypothetical protein